MRRSACLAIRRIKGSHTYGVIAKAIHSNHVEFGISNKVNCVISDNGSNFVKAFTFYEKSNQADCEVNTEKTVTDNDGASGDTDEDEEIHYIGFVKILDV